jgi:hypothetical protein
MIGEEPAETLPLGMSAEGSPPTNTVMRSDRPQVFASNRHLHRESIQPPSAARLYNPLAKVQ